MNSIVEFFIDKARLNYVIFVFVFVGGIYSYTTLSKEIFPPIITDQISIVGRYGGASANILDKIAVQSIEDQINNISGISKLTSIISPNSFKIMVDIKDGKQKDIILQKIKDGISRIQDDFPNDMDNPIVNHVIGVFPLILINVSSSDKSYDDILRVAKKLKSSLSSIDNLADISIYGQGKKQLKIEIDLNKLKAYKISPNMFLSAISNISSIFPIGRISQKKAKNYFISTYNGEKQIEDFLNSMVKVEGKNIRLSDVAEISKSYVNNQTLSSFNGKKAISINVSKGKNGNALELAKEVKNIVKQYQKLYPNFSLGTFSDTSIYIRNRLNTIVSNILLGLILVGITMYLLVSRRISFVVLIGIPTSFVISLIVFKIIGYSINMMSLPGVLIALGIIVDDAIIVAENIQRHIEEGKDIKTASIIGTQEVLSPVLASSLTTIFAFLPILVLSGGMGTFMKIIPIAIVVLILSSLFESFVFLPLHAKHILKKEKTSTRWSKLLHVYVKVMDVFISWKKTTIVLIYILVPLAIYFGFATSKFQLFPKFDGDHLYVSGKLPVDSTLEESYKAVLELESYLLKHKEKYFIQNLTAMAGFKVDSSGEDNENGDNFFYITIDLKKAKPNNIATKYITPYLSFDYEKSQMQRDIMSYNLESIIQKDLEKIAKKYKYEELIVKGPRAGVANTPIEIYLQTNDTKKAHKIVKQIKKILMDTNKTTNIVDNISYGADEIKLKINNYGKSLGVSEKLIQNSLGGYFLESSLSKGFDEDGIFDIVTQEVNKNSLKTLQNFPVVLKNSKQVALNEVVDFHIVKNYAKIFKQKGNRRWLVASEIKQNANANEVLKKIKPFLTKIEKSQSVTIFFGGEEEQNTQLQQEMLFATMIAMVLIFVTFLIMFDSFRYTFIIISVIPLSVLGIFLGHKIVGLDLSVPSIVGILGLIGVVVNDGIIMLDFIRHTKNKQELLDKAKLRLRPIVLTSITTLAGLATLIFFPSGQAVIMQPLAVSLGFGLFWGTFLNLIYLPTIFALVAHKKHKTRAN